MERLEEGLFRAPGHVPPWCMEVFPAMPSANAPFDPGELSPFIENFLPLAEQVWLERATNVLKSGPWTESDAVGREHHLELSALNVSSRHVLLVQLLGEEYEERKNLLQKGREQRLDYEILHKTQQALKAAHELLLEKQRLLKDDLEAAAEIQRRFLPHDAPSVKGIGVATKFQPCALVAGDMFNIVPIDSNYVAIYIFDVSGHGAPAAMLAVSVCQMLQPYSGILVNSNVGGQGSASIAAPKDVLLALDHEFPIERFDKYFTIFYGILDCERRLLTYSNAGHPEPFLVRADGTTELLDAGGTIIGMGGMLPFEQEQKTLERGDKIVLYSDGVTELQNDHGDFFGLERLRSLVQNGKDMKISALIDLIHSTLVKFGGPQWPQDDVTLVGIEFGNP